MRLVYYTFVSQSQKISKDLGNMRHRNGFKMCDQFIHSSQLSTLRGLIYQGFEKYTGE